MKNIFKQALLTSSVCFLACACDLTKPKDQNQDSSDQEQSCEKQREMQEQNPSPKQTVIESRGTAAPGQESQGAEVQKPSSKQIAPVAGPSSEEKESAPVQKTEEVVQPTSAPAPLAPTVQESKPAESAPIAKPALEKQEEVPTQDKVTLETPAGSQEPQSST